MPDDVATIFKDLLEDRDREVMAVMMLTTKNEVIAIHIVSIGTLDYAMAQPREVFKSAVLLGAASIVIAHNHPSGDATPSDADKVITARLVQAGCLLGIEVLDHIIVGADSFVSLNRLGVL
ncbi:MAG: JAB domain-containing protein [Chthonomonadales bacterium]